MSSLAALAKRRAFWVLLGGCLAFMVFYMAASFLLTTNRPFWFVYWKNLPPLPNGETARSFDEVRVRDSIDVLTDQGHAYRCRFLVPGNCWIPIPPEDALVAPNPYCETLPHPEVPPDARASYLACSPHDTNYDIFLIILRNNGQVALWDRNVIYEGYNDFISGSIIFLVLQLLNLVWGIELPLDYYTMFKLLPDNNVVVGLVFVFPGMVGGFILDLLVNRRWRRKPKTEKEAAA